MARATELQVRELIKFRNVYGRGWKGALSRCWLSASYPSGFAADVLQGIRNVLGPSWLYSDACNRALLAMERADYAAAMES
jgi:hypothetical protein